MTHRLAPIAALGIALGAGAGVARGQAAAFDPIERALPPGWTMLATGSELVFRHDKPSYVTGMHHDNAPPLAPRPAAPAGPVITLELRYKLEPRWTPAQLAAAQHTNQDVAAELHALAVKYKIDAIHHSKGKPLPSNADERARLAAYDSEHARIAKRLVALPKCSAGDVSVFDGEDTYAQLSLVIDPPEVIPEAHKIVALLAQHCH